MSGIINTGSFAQALWPGINAWYGKAYNDYETQYTKLFETHKSDKAYEKDVGISSFGLAQIKTQGAGIAYDIEQQGFQTQYNHIAYALGFIVTREMYDDDQYDIIERRARALARAMRLTKELIGANVYNRAFNTSFVGGDGKPMISATHPRIAGGTASNQIAVAADLSEAALEQAIIDIMKFEDDRGLRIKAMPKSLIVAVENSFEAARILDTEYRVGTANNDINVINTQKKFPGGLVVSQYLTDPDAWFIRTDVPNGLKHFVRDEDEFSMDNDFDTDNAKYKARARYSFGWTDFRAIYGSPGA